ncbi:type-1 angiotensin II receptor-like [Rhinatrema bivittatum]|uniref:type-1 angiotensin II receptor-like n=1 Tax=Rhinatrema bivittatum TaxID=194408 RepID=UPI00112DD8C8|nr:type-1 angiotensin II receptor-like [Rhinatrema bivittatum]
MLYVPFLEYNSSNLSFKSIFNAKDSSQKMLNNSLQCTSFGNEYAFIYVLVPTFYIIVFTVGLIGNIIIVVALTCWLPSRSVANIYIVNLAIANLLFVATLPFWAISMFSQYQWPFGSVMCKLCGTLSAMNMYSSIFFITCLSIDLYLAIVDPLKSLSRRTPRNERILALVVWISACAASTPTIWFRQTYYSKLYLETICDMKYPENSNDFWATFVNLMKSTVGFIIPFLLQGICYCLIYKNLLHSPKNKVIKTKNDKVLRAVVAIVLAFLLCWLPFQVVNFLQVLIQFNIITDCKTIGAISATVPITISIAFANSCINPILYCVAGGPFRNQLMATLRRGLFQQCCRGTNITFLREEK